MRCVLPVGGRLYSITQKQKIAIRMIFSTTYFYVVVESA